MIDHQSTVCVTHTSRKPYTPKPNPLLNPSDYVALDSDMTCTHKELFPTFAKVTEHAQLVTLAKTLGLYRAKILADTNDPSLQTKAHRMKHCSDYVAVRSNGSVIAARCHRRGCPLCDSHKSWTLGSKVKRLMDRTDPHTMVCYLLTVSTGENVVGTELREHCKLLSKAFRKFMHYMPIKRDSNIIGTTRSTEVTYSGGLYNPHCHIILWCDGDLEIGDCDNFHQNMFTIQKLWRRALNYNPDNYLITDLRRIEPSPNHPEDKTNTDAIVRTIRYNTKGFNIKKGQCTEMTYPADATLLIADTLKNLRLVSHTGWIKKQMSEQTQVDKIISEQRKRALLRDTHQIVDEGLLHFVWDSKSNQYLHRDEHTNRSRYARPAVTAHYIPYTEYDLATHEKCSPDIPLNSDSLEKSRQLFISNNKEVTELIDVGQVD